MVRVLGVLFVFSCKILLFVLCRVWDIKPALKRMETVTVKIVFLSEVNGALLCLGKSIDSHTHQQT